MIAGTASSRFLNWTIRIAFALVTVIAIGWSLLLWAPWRTSGPLDEHGLRLEYLERVLAPGDDSFDPDASLPMLVDIHGYGAFPEIHGWIWSSLESPVRLILPAGPDRVVIGRSWFPLDENTFPESIERATDRLAVFIRHLQNTRPTIGKPLVTGFSQGGVLSLALAVRHPHVIKAAFPVAGWLPGEMIPDSATIDASPLVIAFHGEDDGPESCREAVESLRVRGWDARIAIFPGAGHYPTPEMEAALIEAVQQVLPVRNHEESN